MGSSLVTQTSVKREMKILLLFAGLAILAGLYGGHTSKISEPSIGSVLTGTLYRVDRAAETKPKQRGKQEEKKNAKKKRKQNKVLKHKTNGKGRKTKGKGRKTEGKGRKNELKSKKTPKNKNKASNNNI